MLQEASEPFLKELVRVIGAPAATATLWVLLYHKFIAPKANGANKELLHKFDMVLTDGFDQLRRDLTTTIQKETENAMTKALFNMWQARDRK